MILLYFIHIEIECAVHGTYQKTLKTETNLENVSQEPSNAFYTYKDLVKSHKPFYSNLLGKVNMAN